MTQRKSLGLVPRPEAGGCERCEALEEQLRKMRDARDEALMDLARERETTNALRLALPPVHMPPASPFGPDIDPERPPLRYVIADRANQGLKTVLGPLHSALKAVGQAALEPRKKK